MMQEQKKKQNQTILNHSTTTKTLIPSVSCAEQMFQKPHPHTTAPLKSLPIQKEPAHMQRKELKSMWPLYYVFLQLEQGNSISLFHT